MPGIPIVLVGKDDTVGASVIEALRPDFDVVHFILSVDDAIEELPYLVKGERPPRQSSTVGSGNYEAGIKAIVFGGAYDAASVGTIVSKVDLNHLAQMRADETVAMPAIGPEYGKRMMERLNDKLKTLKELIMTRESQDIIIQY